MANWDVIVRPLTHHSTPTEKEGGIINKTLRELHTNTPSIWDRGSLDYVRPPFKQKIESAGSVDKVLA